MKQYSGIPVRHSGNKRKEENRSAVLLMSIIPYILLTVLMIAVISLKGNFLIDEIYSYGLSNHAEGTQLSFEDGVKYTPAVLPYADYVTASRDHRFSYQIVWQNQADDVHPPLYYAFVHTLCSFFPGQFSRWFTGAVNIVFALASLYFFRRCIRCFTSDIKILFLMSLAFAVSPGILSAVSFLRMYVMTICWVTATVCIFLEDLKRSRPDPVFFISLGLSAAAGALTHYYCVIFTVFISAVYAVYLLVKKQFARLIGLALTGAVSGTAAYMIFPAMITHVFSGYRGEQSMDNLRVPLSESVSRFRDYILTMDRELFGSIGLITLVLTAAGLISLRVLKKKPAEKAGLPAWLLLYIPCLLYFLFVAKSAPYVTD